MNASVSIIDGCILVTAAIFALRAITAISEPDDQMSRCIASIRQLAELETHVHTAYSINAPLRKSRNVA